MSFIEVRFPIHISYGSTVSPEYNVDIQEAESGHERRTLLWREARREYEAATGITKIARRNGEAAAGDALSDLLDFWHAVGGPLYGFRFVDWYDYTTHRNTLDPTPEDQLLGTGDGARTAFQLQKTHVAGPLTRVRTIRKPVADTILVSVGGVEALSGWTADTTTGVITFEVPPAAGAEVRAGCEFDVPVRFKERRATFQLDDYLVGSASVPLVEVRT